MSAATIIYPHQLFNPHPAIATGRPIFLLEEPLLLIHNPTHIQKLIFHKLTLDAYEDELRSAGHTVTRLAIKEYPTTTAQLAAIEAAGVTEIHVVDTSDDYMEQALASTKLERVWYESPLFILSKAEAIERFLTSKRHLARFYKQLRLDHGILLDSDGGPTGGAWSFDADNRQRLPRTLELPNDITWFENSETAAAAAWAKSLKAETYGEAGCWLPYTQAGAGGGLGGVRHTGGGGERPRQHPPRARFEHFGPYEDAITTTHTRLFHSTLSPLLNVGLLTPRQVLDAALAYADTHAVPINSLEGFVRQILGWREFIRASYECDGRSMRTQNFFGHTRPLPASFWNGTTGITPIDHVIATALQFGYTHHIERLMVMGNFMLLLQTNPEQVYRWFMAMYLDAYDWVMVPNVYGMSQFADGGSFATKPYISGANYITKMSDYPRGDWEEIWTALYWRFIASNESVFAANHRLSMMPRLWHKMANEKKTAYTTSADNFLKTV